MKKPRTPLSTAPTVEVSDLPPTWAEMMMANPVSVSTQGWTVEELCAAWGRSSATVRGMMKKRKWVCIGTRLEPSLSGQSYPRPLYAPPKE